MTSIHVTLSLLCFVSVCSFVWSLGYILALDKLYNRMVGFFLHRSAMQLLLLGPLDLTELVQRLWRERPWLLLPMRTALCSSLVLFLQADLLTLTADGQLLSSSELDLFTGEAKLAGMKTVTVALTPAGYNRMRKLYGQP